MAQLLDRMMQDLSLACYRDRTKEVYVSVDQDRREDSDRPAEAGPNRLTQSPPTRSPCPPLSWRHSPPQVSPIDCECFLFMC